MSAQQFVEKIIAAYNARNLPTVMAMTSENIEFTNNACPDSAPHCARVSNMEDYVAYLTEIDNAWEVKAFELIHIVASGNEVATRTKMIYTSKSTGKTVESEGAHFWTIEDSKLTKVREFYDTAAFNAAM